MPAGLAMAFVSKLTPTDDAQSVKSDWSGDYCERVALRHCFGLKPNQRLNAREKALVSE